MERTARSMFGVIYSFPKRLAGFFHSRFKNLVFVPNLKKALPLTTLSCRPGRTGPLSVARLGRSTPLCGGTCDADGRAEGGPEGIEALRSSWRMNLAPQSWHLAVAIGAMFDLISITVREELQSGQEDGIKAIGRLRIALYR
jgi:hypothetical protein